MIEETIQDPLTESLATAIELLEDGRDVVATAAPGGRPWHPQ
jgi:hypothetical protein